RSAKGCGAAGAGIGVGDSCDAADGRGSLVSSCASGGAGRSGLGAREQAGEARQKTSAMLTFRPEILPEIQHEVMVRLRAKAARVSPRELCRRLAARVLSIAWGSFARRTP